VEQEEFYIFLYIKSTLSFSFSCMILLFFAGKNVVVWEKQIHIVLTSASGTQDVQSLVSSGKFEREFGKLES
jgi:hypothetical protein